MSEILEDTLVLERNHFHFSGIKLFNHLPSQERLCFMELVT